MITDWVADAVAKAAPQLVSDRRHLHQHPELSGQEFQTARYIADRLDTLGLHAQLLLDGTAVVGELTGSLTGSLDGTGSGDRSILVRADIDALPIQENGPDRPYRSLVPGVMHACGHDAHTAIALGVAEILSTNRDRFAGRVRFAFQPAEELVNGAARMIAAGALGDPVPDAVIGLHVLRQLEVGTIGVRAGAIFASADYFTIKVQGRSAHGGLPHQGLDPIPVASAIVLALQTLVSREVSPLDSAVISVGTIHGGEVINNIADSVVLTGCMRAFTPEVRSHLLIRVAEIVTGIAKAAGMHASFTRGPSSPPAISDPGMVELVRNAVHAIPRVEVHEVGTLSVGDDMAEFLEAAPGCYFMLGAGNAPDGVHAPHHHPDFDLDERCLPIGANVLINAVLQYCSSGAPEVTGMTSAGGSGGPPQRMDGR
jgi:amidohydrolase